MEATVKVYANHLTITYTDGKVIELPLCEVCKQPLSRDRDDTPDGVLVDIKAERERRK